MRSDESVLHRLRHLWDLTSVKDEYWAKAQRLVVRKIKANDFHYQAVERETGVPWQVVACIHALECGLDFRKGLLNGQAWDEKTTIVPRDKGPFSSWEDAAIFAMRYKAHIMPDRWTISLTLDFLERYNGLGYRKYHSEVNSPYLWSGTQHYERGKYVSDGRFVASAKSKQVGAVLILKGLFYNGRSSQGDNHRLSFI